MDTATIRQAFRGGTMTTQTVLALCDALDALRTENEELRQEVARLVRILDDLKFDEHAEYDTSGYRLP